MTILIIYPTRPERFHYRLVQLLKAVHWPRRGGIVQLGGAR
jgi:hypothetical protein